MPEQTDVGDTLKDHPLVAEYLRRQASIGGFARAAAYSPEELSNFTHKGWKTRRKKAKAKAATRKAAAE